MIEETKKQKKQKKTIEMFFKTIMTFSIFLTFLKTLVQLKSIHDNVLDIPLCVCLMFLTMLLMLLVESSC
jgi:hypothetical protein